jgi:hypothetical protein
MSIAHIPVPERELEGHQDLAEVTGCNIKDIVYIWANRR